MTRGHGTLGVTARVAVAALVAVAAALAPARAPFVAAAEEPGLSLSTAATYTAVPASRVIRVAIAVTARNTKPNRTSGGILTRYFYDGARLAIHPEARNVAARDGATKLTTKLEPADGFTVLDVRFRSSLFYGQTAKVRVTYDLPSGAPRSASDIRVGTAFVTFVAWAFGDTASVKVEVPSSFEAEATGSDTTKATSGGTTTFTAGSITDVGRWYLVVNADRKNALTNDRIDLPGGEHLVIRAWPEDAEWSGRVRELLTKGLPELVDETGLSWPVDGDIDVFEVHTPLLEGYSGQFYPAERRIEISEDLDDLTILHEAAHAWFNGNLFDGRWINEGLADTYAADALHQVGEGEFQPMTVTPSDRGAVPLEGWTHPGRITEPEVEQREQYGYEASWSVIRSLFAEVGTERMRDVLNAAEDHEIAYVGAGRAETLSRPSDWRFLLDLVEERGGSAGAEALFRRFVVRPEDAPLLDARALARNTYADLVRAAGDWAVPYYVREPMATWQFDEAKTRIEEATRIIAQRDELTRAAGAIGLSPPAVLRPLYETARDSLSGAQSLIASEIAAANALSVATSAVAAPRAPFVALGLLGEQPEADLAAAREAFTAGAPDAEARALAVTAMIDAAVATGRGRAIAGALGIAVGTILLLVVVLLVLRERRRRHARAIAATTFGPRLEELQGVAATGAAELPYGTLADPIKEPPSPPIEDQGDAS